MDKAPRSDAPIDAEDLDALARDLGWTGPVEALAALLAGIAAAPDNPLEPNWPRLAGLAPAPDVGADPALLERLRAARQRLAPGPVAARGAERAERLAALRAELGRRGLDGMILPLGDEHLGEYVPVRAERLAWLTGFTGSAGMAVVLADRAAVFVDGRYTIQAAEETDGALYEQCSLYDEPPAAWLAKAAREGARVGYDPRLHSAGWIRSARESVAGRKVELASMADNPIDTLWRDQPPPPLAPVVPHPLAQAGEASAEKRTRLAEELAQAGVEAAVLTALDSIAWLLNVRGADVPHTPLPLSFAVLGADGAVTLFIDERKLLPETREHLGNAVTVAPPEALGDRLDRLGALGRPVLLDAGSTNAWVAERLKAAGASLRHGTDPCTLPKAKKNPTELEGAREAHRRDGLAMVRFLAWFDREAGTGHLTELDAAAALAAFRARDPLLRDTSFETITAAGPHAALPHYRATPGTNLAIGADSVYLVDSGGQYVDGTTDITRTVAVGAPPAEIRRHATLVLKGHIAIQRCRFPKGTTGHRIDALARQFLWRAGLDFDHGTGHGVGSFLSVHEGPARISGQVNRVALEAGMILSNEPGYYRQGAYGIRIENLEIVTPAEDIPGGERPMHGFETLTLAPIDRRLVDTGLLDATERAWLDTYHARVLAEIGPLLGEDEAETLAWLRAATAPL